MPLSKLVFKPGVNRDQTNYASEGSWYDMNKVRFRSGFPEKIGGWVVQNQTAYVGVARSIFNWSTTDASDLTGIGTNVKMYVASGTAINDITPIRQTFTSPTTNNCFGTTSGSTTVLVTISNHGATDGAYVTFSGAVAVGGVSATNLNKEFAITYVSSSAFTITVA